MNRAQVAVWCAFVLVAAGVACADPLSGNARTHAYDVRSSGSAVTVTYTQWAGASGPYSDPNNWVGSIPPQGEDAGALFGATIAHPTFVSLDAPVTLGAVAFDSAFPYILTGANTLSLHASDGSSSITVSSGSHLISSPLVFGPAVTIDVADASAKLSITSLVDAQATAISKDGAGTLSLGSVRAGPLNVNGGTVRAAAGASGVMRLDQLSIAAGATLDVMGTPLIIDHGQVADIDALARLGFNGGNWGGTGLTSSAAAGDANHITGLAVVANEKLDPAGNLVPMYTQFAAQAVDQGYMLAKHTLNGDTNLDGVINFDDYYQINTGFLSNGTLVGYRWGDFNYDGLINFDDYFLINTAFLGQNSVTGMSPSIVVPEPGLAVGCAIAALTLMGRRVRRK